MVFSLHCEDPVKSLQVSERAFTKDQIFKSANTLFLDFAGFIDLINKCFLNLYFVIAM